MKPKIIVHGGASNSKRNEPERKIDVINACKIGYEILIKKDAIEAIEAGANIVMLDNMEPRDIIETMKGLENRGIRERIIIEASGGINETNISQYAQTGVDIISMGSLTHSCRAVDINMDIIKFIPS